MRLQEALAAHSGVQALRMLLQRPDYPLVLVARRVRHWALLPIPATRSAPIRVVSVSEPLAGRIQQTPAVPVSAHHCQHRAIFFLAASLLLTLGRLPTSVPARSAAIQVSALAQVTRLPAP